MSTFNKISKTFTYGNHTVVLETGEIARQATSAVMVNIAGTVVLVTVVSIDESDAYQDFLPLTVHYQERTYAAGKFPGGYFKREGKPSEKEILTARLIDRALRPLFDKNFNCEVQVVATVLSLNPEVDPDIVALIGASAAVSIANLPFNGPLGVARVGYSAGKYILNPDASELSNSQLDMAVGGTKQAVIMVESEAQELDEPIMLGAINFAHRNMQSLIDNIKEFARDVGQKEPHYQMKTEVDQQLLETIQTLVESNLTTAYQLKNKQERTKTLAAMRNQALSDIVVKYAPQTEADTKLLTYNTNKILEILEKNHVRRRILAGEPRIDGRDTKTIRPITVNTHILPRTHGSALFTRGETQALVVTTLGTERDAQVIDFLQGEKRDSFILHYNFPPFSVGETGVMGSPKRREIGHGMLAKRALNAVLPNTDTFPYVLRVVSEITESNGSSSMATVCGASLSLMDAGVPLQAPVAGIAMGLVKEAQKYEVLSDILGDEDHLGDMDFKVAGTAHGITALQMDIKIDGITEDIMQVALQQAKEGRLHILAIMNQTLAVSRQEMSFYAPRILNLKIPVDKIKDLIGKGGVTIRALTEETGTVIDIGDNGEVRVSAVNMDACEEAKRRILELTEEVKIGMIYDGVVVKIMSFGALVMILPGRQGLVHISQISTERVEQINDFLVEGQNIKVKVVSIDRQGKIRLSMKL